MTYSLESDEDHFTKLLEKINETNID